MCRIYPRVNGSPEAVQTPDETALLQQLGRVLGDHGALEMVMVVPPTAIMLSRINGKAAPAAARFQPNGPSVAIEVSGRSTLFYSPKPVPSRHDRLFKHRTGIHHAGI